MYFLSLFFIFGLLSGCQKTNEGNRFNEEKDLGGISLPKGFSKRYFESLIAKGKIKQASLYVNGALSRDIRNPALHILNGLVYERLRKVNPYQNKELSYIAYRTAKTLNPALWWPHNLLGQASMRGKRYQEAQDHFVNAVILKRDLSSFYGLACASYAVCDLGVAKLAIDEGLRISPRDKEMLRVGILVYSAMNQIKRSKELLALYQEVSGQKQSFLQDKVLGWESAYQRGRICNVSMEKDKEDEGKNKEDKDKNKEDEDKKEKKPSILVDAHLAFYDTTYYETKGQNILLNESNSPLMVALGPGQMHQSGEINQAGVATWSQSTAYQIDIQTITYSMNIANIKSKTLEVYYRPSIETTIDKPSSIFSGVMINAAPQGGQVVKLDMGEKLDLTVKDVSKDSCISMDFAVSLAELKEREDSTKSLDGQTLSVSKMKLGTALRAHSGQTWVVGGLTWERAGAQKQGIPFMESIPFLQYFTSYRRNAWERVRVYCFVTPRIVGEKQAEERPICFRGHSENYKKLARSGVKLGNGTDKIDDILRHLNFSVLMSHYRYDDVAYLPFQEKSISILRSIDRLKTFLYF